MLTDLGRRSDDYAFAVAVQGDGKIVAAGYSNASGGGAFALARYTADGKLDSSFGRGGTVLTSIGDSGSAYAVALQPDGMIVAAGYSKVYSDGDFTVVRYTADGKLDSSFGHGGKVLTTLGGMDVASAVALQRDGKIVAAGRRNLGSFFGVVRYTADGKLDSSFGHDGKVLTKVGDRGSSKASAVAVQKDGKIVAAGSTERAFALVRYTVGGELDSSFGHGGKVLTGLGHRGSDEASAVVVQEDGKIVAAGTSDAYGGNFYGIGDFALVRYTTGGKLDASFGSGGKVLTDLSGAAYSKTIRESESAWLPDAGAEQATGSPAPRWVVADLGTLGGRETQATAINDHGQVVGVSYSRHEIDRAFLWENGRMRNLGVLPGDARSDAIAINERGQVIGSSYAKSGARQAFLWQRGKMLRLGTLGGAQTSAEAINDSGHVAGTSETRSRDKDGYPIRHVFVWAGGKMRDIGAPAAGERIEDGVLINNRGQVVLDRLGHGRQGLRLEPRPRMGERSDRTLASFGGRETRAHGLNEAGQVVGSSDTKSLDDAGYLIRHAFLWDADKMRDLGVLRGNGSSDGQAINQRGQVAGVSTGNRRSRLFLWSGGRMRDLGDTPMQVISIDDRAKIVGTGATGERATEAWSSYVWENGRTIELPTLGGKQSSRAAAANDRGQIVGWNQRRTSDFRVRAVLWTKR